MKSCFNSSFLLLSILFLFAEVVAIDLSNLTHTPQCCNADKLFNCIAEVQPNIQSEFAIITSQGPDNFESDKYSAGINSVFAEYHKYEFKVLPIDRKRNEWEKVKILRDLLKEDNGYKYLVWLDPRVIVVGLTMDLQKLPIRFPNTDLFFSYNDSQSSAPSDAYVTIRKSEWSIEFVEKWWASYDHNQDTPTTALAEIAKNLPVNVEILPPQIMWTSSILNRLLVESSILNMAGEDGLFRYVVFSDSWKTLCDHFDRGKAAHASMTCAVDNPACESSNSDVDLPPMLGLTPDRLRQLEETVPRVKSDKIRSFLENAKLLIAEGVNSYWDIADIYDDAKMLVMSGERRHEASPDSLSSSTTEMEIRQEETTLLVWCYVSLRDTALTELTLVEGLETPDEVKEELLRVVLHAVDVGLDVINFCKEDSTRLSMRSHLLFEVYSNLLPALHSVLMISGRTDQLMRELRAAAMKADVHMERGEVDSFMRTVQGALQIWTKLKSVCIENNVPIPESSLELGSHFFVNGGQVWCDAGKRSMGLQALSVGISAIVNSLEGEYRMGRSPRSSALELRLAKALTSSGSCALNFYVELLQSFDPEHREVVGVYSLGKEHLGKAVQLFSKWKINGETSDDKEGSDLDSSSLRYHQNAMEYLEEFEAKRRRALGEDEDGDVTRPERKTKKKMMKKKTKAK